MTMIQISLPEDLTQRAKSAGLLSDSTIQQLLAEKDAPAHGTPSSGYCKPYPR